MKRLVVQVLSIIGFVLALSGTANAGPAMDVVKNKQTALFDLLKQSSPSQKKIGAIFDEMLDYSALAQASLGTEWAARTPAEQAEFSDLLKQLVQNAYEKNLRKTVDFRIDYLAEEPVGDSVTVKTKAVSRVDAREEPIEIAFKMVQRDGRWLVGDIITEEVSLVSSYRSQFTKVVKKDGFPALIQKMKDKLAKGDL